MKFKNAKYFSVNKNLLEKLVWLMIIWLIQRIEMTVKLLLRRLLLGWNLGQRRGERAEFNVYRAPKLKRSSK